MSSPSRAGARCCREDPGFEFEQGVDCSSPGASVEGSPATLGLRPGALTGPCGLAVATLPMVDPLARVFIIAGLIFLALGVLLYVSPTIPMLGRLPGDIRIERPGLRVYLPITSCLVISILVSAVLWMFSKLR